MGKTEFKINTLSLGISQIYLNKRKVDEVNKWMDVSKMDRYPPLPVFDFGDGRFTLIDGHSRAYAAFKKGQKEILVIVDTDEIVTSETGQLLYRNDLIWCDRFHLKSIEDLENRIITDSQYQFLWVQRCDRMYNLVTHNRADLPILDNLYLYGMEADESILYYEDKKGSLYKMCEGIIIPEENTYG